MTASTSFRIPSATPIVQYTNAKVVLVGDTGVGKSGLCLVLNNKPFVPTESSHGRYIWVFDKQEVVIDNRRKEWREIFLWDLAGQPGYRLIHQLHLNEVVVVLVVFDSRSETEPFAGVHHWVRALRVTQRIQGNSALLMKKFLIAARIDRGGRSVSHDRINSLVQELGFDGYFETSAKEGKNIAVLADSIKQVINWEILPKVISSNLFQRIKAFFITEKDAGRILSSSDDLYRAFLNSQKTLNEIKDLFAQFETCIGRVESQGLIRRLSFGNLVLLQPELLDAYASALINAVKDEPDGLGNIIESTVRAGNFHIPNDERLTDQEQEKLLLIAMIEDMLRFEIALREGPYLVFPSQTTRENPSLPDPEGKAVSFYFEGPVLNIYTTLAVRLSHSQLFKKTGLWKNAVTYTTGNVGIYGMFLNNIGEGIGELILFFDKETNKEIRFHFEEYVTTHLLRQALPETIKRYRIIICPNCTTTLNDLQITLRLKRGLNWMTCPVCDSKVSLSEREEQIILTPSSRIIEMDHAADTQRDIEVATLTLQGKIETNDFDVFLCHNSKDKVKVKEIGEQLKERGILPWLDEWELRPGFPWQRLLEAQIEHIKSAAVFVGKDGIGPWAQVELEALLRQFLRRGFPVIPVLLSEVPSEPKLPLFLEGMTWVDFRRQVPDPVQHLIWGITGKRDSDG